MGKTILLLVVISTGIATFTRPYIGVMAYYCLAIWGPHYIWWWHFEGVRVALIVSILTFLSFLIAIFRNDVSLDSLKSNVNIFVFLLWAAVVGSYWFGPYSQLMYAESNKAVVHFSKIVAFYFISLVILSNLGRIKKLSYVIIGSLIHLTYWGNFQYLSQNWSAFNNGRLRGPGGHGGQSIYYDENHFAMFFVTAIPFLLFWGLSHQKKIYRYLIWLIIPLSWHVIFLTGSRSGLVGVSVSVFAALVLSQKRKLMYAVLVPLFCIAFFLQGGELLKERATTIRDYVGERSAETRIEAWQAAFNMTKENPITGVGPGCFVTAMADYSDKEPRATHNVMLQFAAESGLVALGSYLAILLIFFKNSLRSRKLLVSDPEKFAVEDYEKLKYLNDASTVSFCGLAVCSLFLSLNYYEIFFVLLIINIGVSTFIDNSLKVAS